jgi:hypothetical protein
LRRQRAASPAVWLTANVANGAVALLAAASLGREMGRQFNKLVVEIITPPLRVAGFVVSNVYSVLFGWYGKRLARRAQREFAQEVQEQMSFLFSDYDAQIVSKPEIKGRSDIDWPSVTLSADGMLFEFLLWRGDLSASVAPIHKPNDWDNLLLVLSLIDESVKREGVSICLTLPDS